MPDATASLRELFAAHNVALEPHSDGWLSTGGKYPVCRAVAHEQTRVGQGCNVRLDVEVRIEPNRTLVESFGDWGADAEVALNNALLNFSLSSLHVLLCSLWQQPNNEQTLVVDWDLAGRRWRMYIGNFVRKATDGRDVLPPADLFDIFHGVLQYTQLPAETHWGRLFYANLPSSNTVCEFLIDNEPSTAGEAQIRQAAWLTADFFYSTRMFWIMEPHQS